LIASSIKSSINSLNFQETSMLPTPEQVKEYIAGGLACQHVEVEGDGQHFFATIVSDAFEGKRPIARHQLVYAALGDRMRAEIHALSMKTLTPAEWKPA
jgi:acid stress-induced BolA-like protein IbaG/YrbA